MNRRIIMTIHAVIALFMIVLYVAPSHLTFLIWNLFLAVIPFDLSLVIKKVTARTMKISLTTIWVLFFPNSMYMITDFMHIYSLDGGSARFNYGMLVLGIFLGVLLGARSAEIIFESYFPKATTRSVLGFFGSLSLLSAYGMYLGRYARLNSWDIITNWNQVVSLIVKSFSLSSIEFVLIFAFVQMIILLTFRALRHLE
ncbi:DUF1361 domain-containing protein [Weissella soli]|uniref:Putative membrane protein n=1 Tax=Weissella soli TaxID=155866 RepID=A0A288Q6Z6_9LACO|nr:DUF1361 domain-containing protein [Weissella soli]AOT56645.1 hypothetical protein WSWS_01014 [Weissella soli]MCT8395307.1 DUF1361 domain-containing protein [Weissella soli]NKY83099.1 DUF1361 domain-containing protein [Weissella soli]RDL12208.1 putative membrane protein [Weissella soli]GEN92546.1 membrane protein [Weissella soli]